MQKLPQRLARIFQKERACTTFGRDYNPAVDQWWKIAQKQPVGSLTAWFCVEPTIIFDVRDPKEAAKAAPECCLVFGCSWVTSDDRPFLRLARRARRRDVSRAVRNLAAGRRDAAREGERICGGRQGAFEAFRRPQFELVECNDTRIQAAPLEWRVAEPTRASAWRQKQKREAAAASAVGADRILKLGSLLAPQHSVGQSKVRLGSKYDGGYICLDDFDGITTAFSLGIDQNDDWDVEIAGKGIVVHQFDHFVDQPPHVHPNCHFHKKRIVPRDDGTANTETIAHLVEKYTRGGDVSLILKIDIENDEWQVFAETTRDHLAKFFRKLFANITCLVP